MFSAGSPSEALAAAPLTSPPAGGEVVLGFALRQGRSRLIDLYQRSPLRVLLPEPAGADLPLAAMINTGGGLVAGDRLRVEVGVAAGAGAQVMAQAAEKVYRSTGATTRIEAALDVAADGWLEWLPQETILFAESRLARRLRLSVAASARVMAGEMLVFGRVARGERTRTGFVRDAIELHRDGRLAWADALHLEGDYGPVLDGHAGFDGAVAAATFLYAGPDAAGWLDTARSLLDAEPVRNGATLVNGVLVARWLAAEPHRLRGSFGRFWAGFRAAVAGLPPVLPRLWQV